MQSRKRLLRIISTTAVIILCTANVTYCWQSISQTTLSVFTGAISEPDEPDNPDESGNPNKPDKPNESEKPDKPEQKPQVSEKPQKPPKDSESSTAQTGKADADTGDTHEFLRYLCMMLLSYAMIIVVGVTIIILNINRRENRRT